MMGSISRVKLKTVEKREKIKDIHESREEKNISILKKIKGRYFDIIFYSELFSVLATRD